MVARILFNNGKVFMQTIFNDREHLATATNKLFEMGFFLLAFGIGLYVMEHYRTIDTYKLFFEALSVKMGGYTLFLGALVMFFTFMYFRGMKYRKRSEIEENNKMILNK